MGSRRLALAALFLLGGVFLPTAPAFSEGEKGPTWITRIPSRPLAMPYDIAVDRKGVLFLLESSTRSVSIFSPKGEFLREIQGRGAWKDPSAIAVGPGGGIYIADGVAGRVLEIDLSGKTRREFHAGGNARLTGVAVFGDAVYCVDNRNHKVLVFRKPGSPPESWGKRGDGAGEFQSPFRLAIDPAGRVFVTDVLNARVQWFSAFGQHLGTLKRFGAGEGKIFRPTGLALDSRGRIWVGDSYTGLVQRFDETGGVTRALGVRGRPLVFGDPVSLAVNPEGLWVADQRENRLGRFQGE